jgi:hypothetical protein
MIVEILDGLDKPVVLHATRLVVRSDQGTPLAAVVEWIGGGGGTHVTAVTAQDRDFNQVLANLGIDRVEVRTLHPKGIREYDWSV